MDKAKADSGILAEVRAWLGVEPGKPVLTAVIAASRALDRVTELEKIVEHTMMEIPGYNSERSIAVQLPLEVKLLRTESEQKLEHASATGERLATCVAALESRLSRHECIEHDPPKFGECDDCDSHNPDESWKNPTQ